MSARSRNRVTATAIATALGTAASLLTVPAALAAPDGSDVVINEVYTGGGNSGSVYSNDFVELYNPTDVEIILDGHTLTRYSSSGNAQSDVVTLNGIIPAGGHFLVQTAAGNSDTGALPTPDLDAGNNLGFGRATGGAELKNAGGETIDLLGWGNIDVHENAAAPSPAVDQSVQRSSVGVDSNDNSADFSVGAPTPTNAAGETAGEAGGDNGEDEGGNGEVVEATIAEIQGTGAESELKGQTVVTEGVVTASYPEGGMDGIVIQTGGTGDSLGEASDAIFVYLGSGGTFPEVGDSVSVTGEVEEYYDVTQLGWATVTQLDEPLDPVTPLEIDTLPAGDDAREAYEHMLVLPGAHTISNNYGLNTYGELGLAPGDEAFRQPTDVVLPGEDANALQAEIDEQAITLDDGRTRNYMNSDQETPLPYIAVDGKAGQSIRTGDQVSFQNPVVVDYDFGVWRFQPTEPITGNNTAADLPITWEDSRPAALAEIDTVEGDYSIASFNVLNYFTSLGKDEAGCEFYTDMYGTPIATDYCNVRGAYSEEAFADQQAKIVAAINKMDVDVLGLEEIENTAQITGDDADRDVSLAKLVDALNKDAGSKRWAYVESPAEVGIDEDVIRVGFIYNPKTVAPVGESRIFNHDAFTGDARQPLAQEFEAVNGEGNFVAVTNHFKSKGSVARGDEDMGDGQGNNANLRAAQSQALIDALEAQDDWTDTPTFILGDLNAYTKEDAARVLEVNGYTNINTEFAGSEPTYQFSGLLGSLDHAYGNEAAMDLVQDAVVWNINADEPVAYEYSRRNYNTVDFFDASPFRSSDHDPIKVGFNLSEESNNGGGTPNPGKPGDDKPGEETPAPEQPGEETPAPEQPGDDDQDLGLSSEGGIFAIIVAAIMAVIALIINTFNPLF